MIVLLCVCITVDYADTNITNNATMNMSVNDSSNVLLLDDDESNIVVKSSDKIHTVPRKVAEQKLPMITMTGKPSCGCNYGYYWHTRTYINYCPNCHHYNCLGNKHKHNARFEQEISCYNCDSDFCICCGKEKYSWSRVYLRRV